MNCRNIGSDVKSRVSASKEFMFLEVKSRVIAAVLENMGIESMEEIPSDDVLPSNLLEKSEKSQKDFLHSLASNIVDEYILGKDRMEHLLQKSKEQLNLNPGNERATDGRYLCRHPGCPRSFKFDGKSRREHELNHCSQDTGGNKQEIHILRDDLYNYQCCLLDIGMLILNFYDAISMGDGQRIVRCWKYMLLYLRADGGRSRKYALEAFYLLCQCYALLSERGAHQLIWNRFAKTRRGVGGNIPLDLSMEHYNGMLKNILRMLGSNVSDTATIDRYCKALVVNRELISNWDAAFKKFCKSGKHISKFPLRDLEKLVKKLMEDNAL